MARNIADARIPGSRLWMLVALALASCLLAVAPADAETPRHRNVGQQVQASSAAQAIPFGAWLHFEVGRTGSTTGAFTFFSGTPVLLRVTDAYCRGDEFRVFDRGFALFNTSIVATDPRCDDEPEAMTGGTAWRDPSYSKGRFLLQPGSHSVKIRITDSPFGAAGAFLRIDKRPVR
jgi:hypothetical protein